MPAKDNVNRDPLERLYDTPSVFLESRDRERANEMAKELGELRKQADALIVGAWLDEHIPADVREFGERHGIKS